MNEYTEMNDRTLVEMTLLGKEDAFEELVMRHESAVKRSAYRVTGNTYSAEDASQDAFVAAWMKLDTLEDFGLFEPWVCRIAANRAKNLMAKYRREIPELSLDLEQFQDLCEADEREIADIVSLRAGEVQDEKLAAALDTLSEKVREVVRLHYFDELSVDEIADRLSLPAGTVKWRLSEGRKKLRKEYGKMEKSYDEKDTVVRRVMYAVEQLKLWRLRDDKRGFEDEYREVLAMVEELDDGEQKSHAAADVLLMGYWWIDGERNNEVLERIKREAEAGHNEEVMCSVAGVLVWDRSVQDVVEYAKNEMIPYLEKHGFKKALGKIRCEIAGLLKEGGKESKIAMLREAMTTLTKKDAYWHIAKKLIEYLESLKEGEFSAAGADVMTIKRIDGVRYHWSFAVGNVYSEGASYERDEAHPTFVTFTRDDENRMWGELAHKAGDELAVTPHRVPIQKHYVAETDAVVTTPAGTFENCEHVIREYCSYGGYKNVYEFWFCPGVGPVKGQCRSTIKLDDSTWELSSYDVSGEGRFPLGLRSRREFVCTYADKCMDDNDYEYTLEVVYDDGDTTFLLEYQRITKKADAPESWRGLIYKASSSIWQFDGENWMHSKAPVEYYNKAAALAKNVHERALAVIGARHARRIYETAYERNVYPEQTKCAFWDPFTSLNIKREDGEVKLVKGDDVWRGVWYSNEEDFPDYRTGYIMVHNSLYEEINTLIGAIWSDKWEPGYKGEHHASHWGEEADNTFEVKDGGTVETPAGTFENCILVELTSENFGVHRYLHGKKEYYYAPGVGIVKFVTYYGGENDESFENIEFLLTKYDGTAEGYFPIENGLFRRMEPVPMPEHCEIWVENTVTADENGVTFFLDQCANMEKDFLPASENKE